MKKINALRLEVLKRDDFVAFMRYVSSIVPDYPVLQQWFKYFVDRFLADYAKLDEVFLKYDIDACTKAVQEADKERDRAFRHLKDLIDMALTYPKTEAKRQAAETLMRIVELYGGYRIPFLRMAAKTAAISNMVEDLETKFSTEVEALGIGELLGALKTAQQHYDEKYLARNLCESEVVKGAMVEARKNMDLSYRLMIEAVNLKVYEDEEGQLDGFINMMNVEVGRYRTITGQGQAGSSSSSSTKGGDDAVAEHCRHEE